MTESCRQFMDLVIELENEFGTDYLIYAIKKINDRQMLFIELPPVSDCFYPILKVLDIISTELENKLFHSQSEHSENEMEQVITTILQCAASYLQTRLLEHPADTKIC